MPRKRKTPKEGAGNSEPSPPECQVSAATKPSGTQISAANQQQSYPSAPAAVPRAGSAPLAPRVAGAFRDVQGGHGECNGSGQGVGTGVDQVGRGASLERKRVADVRDAASGGFGGGAQGRGGGREPTTPTASFHGITPPRQPVVAGGPNPLPDLPQAVASQPPAPYSRPAGEQVGQCAPFVYGGMNHLQAGAYYMSPPQQYAGNQQVQPPQFAPAQQPQPQFTGPPIVQPSYAGVQPQYPSAAQHARPQYIAGQASQPQYLVAPQVRPPFSAPQQQQPRVQPGVPKPLCAGAQPYIGAPQASYAPAQPARPQASFMTPPNSSSVTGLSQQFEKQVTIQDPAPNTKQDAGMNLPPITQSEQRSAPPASSKSVRFPLRPGIGRTGIKCIVKANHFFAELPDKDLHQYDVTISPEVTSRGVNRAVMEQLVKLHRDTVLGRRLPAYDGRKSLYTAGPLPFQSKEFSISLPDDEDGSGSMRRERVFKVVVKFAARADLHHLGEFLSGRQADAPQEALQVLDIVLRELPTHRFCPVGRSFYSPDLGKRQQLGEGLESWRGFYQSIRPTQMGLSLNIDMSSTAFIEALPVIEFVSQLLNKDVSRHLSDADRIKVKKALRGVKVEVTHRGNMRRKYRISGLTSQPTQELTFPVDDKGTMKSVVEYFRETYGYLIRCVGLPCLQVGNQQRPNYLPMEVCKIVAGQRYSKRLNEKQITALLKVTCQRPIDRERDIMETVRQNSYAEDPYAREFGIKISAELASVEARILPAPQLKYHDTGRLKICQPEIGQWNMRDKVSRAHFVVSNVEATIGFSYLDWIKRKW